MKKLPPSLGKRRGAAIEYIGGLLPFQPEGYVIVDATRLGVRGPTQETLVNLWCPVHEEEHTVRFIHLKQKSFSQAPCCTRVSKEQVIDSLHSLFPHYEVVFFDDIINSRSKVKVKCKKHGTESISTVSDRLRTPRLKCCKDSEATRTRKDWLDSIKHNKLSYSGLPYNYSNIPPRVASTHRIKIVCPDHGEREVYAFSHLTCRLSCCTTIETADYSRHDPNYVIAELRKHSPQYKYRIKNADGPYSEWIVQGKCKEHGIFNIDTKAKRTLSQTLRYGGLCPDCTRTYLSGVEQDFSAVLDRKFPGLVYRTNSWLKGFGQKRLDFYIPKAKLGVEINGTYWHSEEKKGKDAHSDKRKFLADKGILLLQFTDSELHHNKDLIFSMLASRLGLNKRLYARKTLLATPTPAEAREFFLENHISGFVPATYYIGLKYKDKLVSVVSFGKSRFNSDADYELLRFATLRGFTVVGGLSKMLQEFRRIVKAGKLLTYADLRYGNGNAYEKVGFSYAGETKPGFSYFKGLRVVSRQQAVHKKLPKLLGDVYDPSLSQDENMLAGGWRKIYDAGHKIFLLTIKE